MNDSTRDLLIRGMVAARAKDVAEATRYLEWVLRLDPPLETRIDALYWLSEVVPDPGQKRRLLEEALAYNASDMRCRRALAMLNGELKAAEIIDPDHLERLNAAAEPQAAHADRFTCPQCGGRMTFAPDGQSLTCEYCEARQKMASNPDGEGAAAENFLIAMATRKGHIHPVNRQTFNCQGCGIDFLLPPQQLSITCPYCGSAYVVRQPHNRELIDPHLILPFQVNERQARQTLKAWFTELKPVPGPELQVERGAGLYLPVWSFEMAGTVPWHCLVEDRRNHWVPETGDEIVYHRSVIVPASPHLSDDCAAELRAFDLTRAAPFDERYLADWPAESYQVSVGDASLEARSWTYEFEKQSVRERMLHPVRDLSFNSLNITVESFQLALVPVWISHYRLGAERYEVIINGQSGAVRGERPANWLVRLINH